ncbi:MAG TPA: hypothetical protein VLC93_03890 [Myxococcota bacterium]|nr:hypothetical protein [Myxococcota bacterium]
MHATLNDEWLVEIQQYDAWKNTDQNASRRQDATVKNDNREEALVKAQQLANDTHHWHHAMASAKEPRATKSQQVAQADIAHAQAGQLGALTAPEQVVRKVGAIEAEMRKGHVFISGTDPHEAEVERLGMADDNVEGASEVKHVWQVFMEHQRRDQKRRS